MVDIRKNLKQKEDRISKSIIAQLQFLGLKCVIEARTNRTFGDVTSNLISSIGFIVFKDGKIVGENYETKDSAPEGELKGKNLATSIMNKNPDGYGLIVTAGMEYAAAVEARGKNVLASAENLAQQEWPKLVAKIKNGS